MKPKEKVKPEYEFDMDNLPKIKHLWTDRGLVMTCENAGHPSHRHFKIKR